MSLPPEHGNAFLSQPLVFLAMTDPAKSGNGWLVYPPASLTANTSAPLPNSRVKEMEPGKARVERATFLFGAMRGGTLVPTSLVMANGILVEARGMATAAFNGAQEKLTCGTASMSTISMPAKPVELQNHNTRHAAFPEERLRWVPRKRHNSRWPIEPRAHATRMMADMQPLIEYDLPEVVEHVEATSQADTENMGRRSTRRLSRRVSLFPRDLSPRKVSAITLSPTRMIVPNLSPVKRSPVAFSPKKVADSPLRTFRVDATPTKVVLESPKVALPLESPSKSSPLPAAKEAAQTFEIEAPGFTLASLPSDHSPLVFDQPILEISVEPQYEVRRRRSLQSAQRSDRRSGGFVRLVSSSIEAKPLNRRHSFNPMEKSTSDARARRSTLDVFSSVPDGARDFATGSGQRDEAAERSLVLDPVQEEDATNAPYLVVKVDVGTNLDIFGQSQRVANNTAPAPHLGVDRTNELVALTVDHPSNKEDVDTCVSSTATFDDATLVSPEREVVFGVADTAAIDESASGSNESKPRYNKRRPAHLQSRTCFSLKTHRRALTFRC